MPPKGGAWTQLVALPPLFWASSDGCLRRGLIDPRQNCRGLSPIAIITFGTALALSSNEVRHGDLLKHALVTSRTQSPEGQSTLVGSEFLASEMASGSAGLQALAGRGIESAVLVLVAFLALILTGGALSGRKVQGALGCTGFLRYGG